MDIFSGHFRIQPTSLEYIHPCPNGGGGGGGRCALPETAQNLKGHMVDKFKILFKSRNELVHFYIAKIWFSPIFASITHLEETL